MNNSTADAISISSVVISELTQAAYLGYVSMLADTATIALLAYTTVLAIPQEMVYMWLSPKPFSIPNLLYAFTRYGSLIEQVLSFRLYTLPPGRLCDNLANVQSAVFILTYIGLQGLLVARAYSLCQGNKVIAGALFFFGGGLTLLLYKVITSSGCSQRSGMNIQVMSNLVLKFFASFLEPLVTLAQNVCNIATDLVVFCICLWKVWDTWKLKHETGIRSGNDLVSVLLKQTISRFFFAIVITITVAIIDQFRNNIAIDILGDLQRSISAILIADFSLDLRQRNSTVIQATNITLPTIQIQSVTNYIHQSILVEMGDDEVPIHVRVEGDDDLSTGSPNVEIRREEST